MAAFRITVFFGRFVCWHFSVCRGHSQLCNTYLGLELCAQTFVCIGYASLSFVADSNIHFSMMPFLPHVPAGCLGVKCGILTPCPHRHSGGRRSGEWMSLFVATSWVPRWLLVRFPDCEEIGLPFKDHMRCGRSHYSWWNLTAPRFYMLLSTKHQDKQKNLFFSPSSSPWLVGTWSHFPTCWTAALFILYFGSVGL